MKRSTMAVVVLAAALPLMGCGNKERDELRTKVTTLEQQLAKANSELAEKDKALNDARANADTSGESLKQCQTNVDVLTSKLVKVEAELAKLKKKKK